MNFCIQLISYSGSLRANLRESQICKDFKKSCPIHPEKVTLKWISAKKGAKTTGLRRYRITRNIRTNPEFQGKGVPRWQLLIKTFFFPAAPHLFTTSVGFFLSQEFFLWKQSFLIQNFSLYKRTLFNHDSDLEIFIMFLPVSKSFMSDWFSFCSHLLKVVYLLILSQFVVNLFQFFLIQKRR